MATLAVTHSVVATERTFGGTVQIFVKEAKYEFLKLARTKTFSLSTIGFPVMFYVLFGLSNKGHEMDGMDAAKYMLASYAAFGVIGAALFGVGVGMASERALGWLELKRSSPMPAMAYLVSKCISAQAFGLIIVSLLMGLAVAFGGVHLTGREVVMVLGMTVAGSIPFAALGLLIALLVPPNAASGVINLIYLPMSFMSGLWIPIQYLPKFLRPIAPYLPACHLSQLMETIFGYQQIGSTAGHWEGLAGFTLLVLGACWAVFQRAEQDA
ncbi:ABC transporter permease [Granulicella tundricola]|uniref:Transport permease protein n=1 Tax=Granulicella tundricola (strain ATCC BAA-1859 / DSM 23138 / MP5ACTX9) TaxID=1198114 RepID=E8WWP6_GRATM|nr:ABC transporter permease [Granulicella tundricola]ADW67374.1 ABC-2 type transporter [Granulicella tundricola MP5ACTX9]